MISLLEDATSRKPHFRYSKGVWSCATYGPGGWVMGFGYSIKQAWTDYCRFLLELR